MDKAPTPDLKDEENTKKQSLKTWLKKLGVVGFLFFLIKGLVWVYIFIQAGKCAME